MSTYSTINTHTSGGVEQGHQDPIIFVCFSSSEYFGVKLFNPKRTSFLTSACLLLSLPMNAGVLIIICMVQQIHAFIWGQGWQSYVL